MEAKRFCYPIVWFCYHIAFLFKLLSYYAKYKSNSDYFAFIFYSLI